MDEKEQISKLRKLANWKEKKLHFENIRDNLTAGVTGEAVGFLKKEIENLEGLISMLTPDIKQGISKRGASNGKFK